MNKFLYILKNRFDVQIKDETSVLKYIEAYPNCNIDVTYAVTRLRDEFGNNADIVLELRKMCFDNQMLVIIVRQKEYSDDIMTILDKISDELDEDATEFLPWILLTTDFHRIE
jgi:archaellum biogenesis ATPase FlaH